MGSRAVVGAPVEHNPYLSAEMRGTFFLPSSSTIVAYKAVQNDLQR